MKKIGFIWLLCLLLLPATAARPVKVACVGNSVTYGLGLPDRETQSYPAVLQRLLGKAYEVRNFGHSGTTLLRKGHRPYNEQQEYRDALAFKADWVVLHLGLNDTDPRNWPNYNSDFNFDYQTLINSFRAVNPKVKIWICLLTPIFDRHPRFESGTRDWHEAIRKHIRQVAKSNNVGLIDLFSPFYPRPDLFPDAIHPNPEGAGILAQTVYSALTGNYGGLRMDPLYGNGMVMQQHEPVVFSGTANAGETVRVAFNGTTLKATAGTDGRWKVAFRPTPAGGPYQAKIVARSGKLLLSPIYVGEVWLCSGQSNMELPVMATRSARNDTAGVASQRLLHLYNMPAAYPTNAIKWPREALDSVNKLLYLRHEGWQQCSPKSVAHFSSVAYHFGRQLADSLQVPVGIICNAVGGTTTESWIDRHTLEWKFPAILRDWYHGDFGQPWARERALLNISNAANPKLQRHPYQPAYMFEAGMLPLRGYAIKGVAWYQGESNAHNIELHARLFTLLEKSWRAFFGNGNLPFYFVQLSSLNRPSWPEFRNSQRLLAKQLPHTWMVVTTDVGDSLDVHYRNKQPVGERLARQALRHTYGHSLVSEGPACAGVALQATKGGGGELVLTFENAEGLHATGTSVIGFELAGDDGIYHPATAHITGGKVTVSSQQVGRPLSVRYAWQPYTRANLVNGAGLPCSTFQENVSQ